MALWDVQISDVPRLALSIRMVIDILHIDIYKKINSHKKEDYFLKQHL